MKHNIHWQDIAMVILSAILMIGVLYQIIQAEDIKSCELTGVAFGVEHCLDDSIYNRPDPPLTEIYQQPKLIRTYRVGDDVEPHIHLIYEVVIDGEVLRYAQTISPE